MTAPDPARPKPSWFRDLLIGFVVWLIAFIAYTLPALVVAMPMGFELGPKLRDSAEVGRQISLAISEMYRTNPYLLPGYIVILAGLIFWRSRVRSRVIADNFMLHGALIAVIPAVMSVVQIVMGHGVFLWAVSIVVFFAAGIAGMRKRISGKVIH